MMMTFKKMKVLEGSLNCWLLLLLSIQEPSGRAVSEPLETKDSAVVAGLLELLKPWLIGTA